MRVMNEEMTPKATFNALRIVDLMMMYRQRRRGGTLDSGASNVMLECAEEGGSWQSVPIQLASGTSTALQNEHGEIWAERAQNLMSMGRIVELADCEVHWRKDHLIVSGPGVRMRVAVENYTPRLTSAQFDQLKELLRSREKRVLAAVMTEKSPSRVEDLMKLHQHVSEGHREYQKWCPGCVRASTRSRRHESHQRSMLSSVGELSFDVAGPFVADADGNQYACVFSFRPRNMADPSVMQSSSSLSPTAVTADSQSSAAAAAATADGHSSAAATTVTADGQLSAAAAAATAGHPSLAAVSVNMRSQS